MSVAMLGAAVLALATTACEGDGAEESENAAPESDQLSGQENGHENAPEPGDGPAADEELTEETDGAEESVPDDGPAGTGDDGDGGAGADDEAAEDDASGGAAGPADGAEADGLPWVVNYFGEENVDGNPEREPENLVLTEHTSLQEVTWESWNDEEAVGVAALSGMWCLPECADKPYEATVTLSEPETVGGEEFYTVFEVDAPEAERYGTDDLDGERPLAVPGPAAGE